MIHYVNISIFDSSAQTLVNPVNTIGVMGKGLALKFKELYPEMYGGYKSVCKDRTFDIGSLHIHIVNPNRFILCLPTKKHWRRPSRIEYIEEGLKAFVSDYKFLGITSVAFPKLGCGLGGLNWEEEVQPAMDNYLNDLDIDITIHV
jgi:O-acetyl-ADP-ribose deacetylase (regulator of RNase III)